MVRANYYQIIIHQTVLLPLVYLKVKLLSRLENALLMTEEELNLLVAIAVPENTCCQIFEG